MADRDVTEVYEYAQALVEKEYKERLLATYLIGSLSHGSFSRIASDIDIAFILSGAVSEEDWKTFDRINLEVKAAGLALADRISIFWTTRSVLEQSLTSGAFPTPQRSDGLFPPFDVLDLLQNGQLIQGSDVRGNMRIPTENDLYIAGVEFLLSYVRDQATPFLKSKEKFLAAAPEKRSKTILFPVRLLYTLKTERVGNNTDAADFAMSEPLFSEDERALIQGAMQIRNGKTPDESLFDTKFTAVGSLYHKILSLHAERMHSLGKEGYAAELEEWRRELDA